ncbi:MAG TPA: hypothetical protein VFB72_10880 [Verrucomicrobiae bacterium]|nr:hypothetical protein [Verrucomicrobiae bacterium]
MLKHAPTRIFGFARYTIPALLAGCLLGLAPQSRAVTQSRTIASPAIAKAMVQNSSEAVVPALDTRRLFALGMIETGNDDTLIGSAGEVSRYQLSPSVWKSYSKSDDYVNPQVALQVARAHWIYLANYFKEKTGRNPTDFDMYVLWNTRYGYYAHKGFSQQLISPVVRDRAQRFVNLVYRPNY